jgi:hypothetical protein
MEFIGQILDYGLKTDNLILIFLVVTCLALTYLVRWTLMTSTNRENKYIEREEKYISTIDNLTGKFTMLETVKEAVERIEHQVMK